MSILKEIWRWVILISTGNPMKATLSFLNNLRRLCNKHYTCNKHYNSAQFVQSAKINIWLCHKPEANE